ncbi:MAG: hypothetical protein ACU0GG_06625 [Paracoccaceae bacterium]
MWRAASVLIVFLVSIQANAQSAGEKLAQDHPNRILVARQADATDPVSQVITSALAPQDQTAIRQNFALAGVSVGSFTPLNVTTLSTDLARPGTAFVANSSDFANPLLSSLFVPGNRFFVFLEDAGITKTALSRPDGTRLTTDGVPRVIDGSNKLLLITAGQPENGIGTLLYPQGTTTAQLQQLLQQYRLSARELRVLDNMSVGLLSSPDTALLNGDAMFAVPSNDFVLNYAPGMKIYTVENKARLEEVTPDSLKVAPPPTPAPKVAENAPKPAPQPKAPRSVFAEDLQNEPAEVAEAPSVKPEVAPFPESAVSARTVIQTTDVRGKSTSFDTDSSLVTWGAPGLLVYLPKPMTCSAPTYLYDVNHPILVKRILEAPEPWEYVRRARYNYFSGGCRGSWRSDHKGKVLFSYKGRQIGEAVFAFDERSDRLTWVRQQIDPTVAGADPTLPGYVSFWHQNFALSIRDPQVLSSLEASDTAEAAHYLGVEAPARWKEKQPALEKAICMGYPRTAYEAAAALWNNGKLISSTKAGKDEARLFVAKSVVAGDVRSRVLVSRLHQLNVDVDTPIEIVKEQGPCITVAMMNGGPTADVPPRAAPAARLLQNELLSDRCNVISLLTDKYARRSGGQSAPLPGTRFTPGRSGCTAQWLGSRLTLGIDRITNLSCDGGNGRYVCSFDIFLSCRADFGDFSSGNRLGTDDLICNNFTATSTPGTAVFTRDGGGWRVDDFVPVN